MAMTHYELGRLYQGKSRKFPMKRILWIWGQDKVRETPKWKVWSWILIQKVLLESVTRPDEAGKTIIGEDIGNVSSTFVEEAESVKSKERSQTKTLVFPFENLNRAVDELYLLSELECDVEQMDEAILVLEEATSDFQGAEV
ncbi:hypothetical protein J5N97_015817 [Dioscorea zingiberensis]|uniref:S phase cyclin A-associated protein in the endoplasmic reticulum N-terminal domain-containing protein n=1 Tax=Dioscorea zingiberensis TaxID=325984 RepID=A0A9D5CIH5_9LILI|nr:hypothetical protein J5N97_015817 [Dioscorea zingiberensis]